MKWSYKVILIINIFSISLTSIGMEHPDKPTQDMSDFLLPSFENFDLGEGLELPEFPGVGVNRPTLSYPASQAHDTFFTQEELDLGLMQAVQRKDRISVQLYLDKGANPNTYTAPNEAQEKAYPLHLAAFGGLLEIARLLLKYGAKIDLEDNQLQPIHMASTQGYASIVQLLIEHGACADAESEGGMRPIHYAIVYGHANVTEVLVRNGANLYFSGDNGLQPLHQAILFSRDESIKITIVECLLRNGADVNAADKGGNFPIHYAASGKGSKQLVELLVSYGADLNVRNTDGYRPLDIAQRTENAAVANWISHRQNALAENQSVKTRALLPARIEKEQNKIELPKIQLPAVPENLSEAIKENNIEFVKRFLEQKTNVNKLIYFNNEKMLPIDAAATVGNIGIAELLVSYGADINSRVISCNESFEKQLNGIQPIHLAALHGHIEFAKWLIMHGADLHATGTAHIQLPYWVKLEVVSRDAQEMKLIHCAALQGKIEFIKWLSTQESFNIAATDKAGNQAIHWASINGYIDLIKWLISNGANPEAKNKKGKKPLDLAKACDQKDAVALLKKYEKSFLTKLITW